MRRTVAALVLGSVLSGCSSWRLYRITPQQLIAHGPVKQIRLMVPGNALVVLHNPSISGDSLRGWDPQALAPRAVALADVRRLESWQSDGGKTGLLVVGIVGGLAAIALLVVATALYDDS